MKIDYLVIADAAASADGKLYIHGAAWDTMGVLSFPAVRPTMAIAIRFRVPWNETDRQHSMDLDVLDEDGRSILPPERGHLRGTLTIGRPDDLPPGAEQTTALVIELQQLRFEKPGTYVVTCSVDDGVDEVRSPFRAVQRPLGPNQGMAR